MSSPGDLTAWRDARHAANEKTCAERAENSERYRRDPVYRAEVIASAEQARERLARMARGER